MEMEDDEYQYADIIFKIYESLELSYLEKVDMLNIFTSEPDILGVIEGLGGNREDELYKQHLLKLIEHLVREVP